MGLRDLFSQWNTKTVGGSSKLGIDDYALIQDPVHLEFANAKDIDAINAVGQATNLQSQSGPIPGTFAINQIVADTSGSKAGNLKIASAGEVWQLYGFCVAAMSGRSGSCTHEVFLRDTVNSLDCEIIDVSASSSQLPFHENSLYPVFVDENISIMYEVTGTFTDSTLQFVAARVR